MRNALRICYGLALVVMLATTALDAQGKPAWVPVGPPSVPVEPPATPPADPPSDLVAFVCSLLPVPYLCD